MTRCSVFTPTTAAVGWGIRLGAAALTVCAAAGSYPAHSALPYAEFLLPGEVVRQNTVRLAIPREIGTDSVVAAWFHVHCTALRADSSLGILDTLVALDTVPPFDTSWDCATVPDQDNSRMYFWCDVLTSSGEVKGGREDFRRPVTLDRDSARQGPVCRSLREGRAVVFDGSLGEWSDKAAVAFAAGDNRVHARARWTDRFLFVAVRVDDDSLVTLPEDSAVDSASLRRYDGVEVYLDVRHERTPVRGDDDFRVCVSPDGRTTFSPRTGPQQYRPLVGVSHDSAGYSLEVGILWEALGYAPYKGSGLGFNVVVVDRDTDGSRVEIGDWAGAGALRLQNPHAWGAMAFAAGPPAWPWVALVLLLAAAGVAWALWRFTRRPDLAGVLSSSPFMGVVASVLEDHYADPDVNARTIAGEMHLSGPRLVRMIRRETGMDFRRFVNEFRVSKAKSLLAGSDLPLSEIARRTGYESPSHFTHFFERATRLSPARYRALHGNVAVREESDTGSGKPPEPTNPA